MKCTFKAYSFRFEDSFSLTLKTQL